MATTKEFLSMVTNMCNMWGFSYMPIDNGMVDYEKLPSWNKPSFRYNHQTTLMLQSNKLGHQDLYIYSIVENGTDKVVAVMATNVANTLLQSCQKYGNKFYGFPYRTIEEVPMETDCYYFLF